MLRKDYHKRLGERVESFRHEFREACAGEEGKLAGAVVMLTSDGATAVEVLLAHWGLDGYVHKIDWSTGGPAQGYCELLGRIADSKPGPRWIPLECKRQALIADLARELLEKEQVRGEE